jgi:hypothetical protein
LVAGCGTATRVDFASHSRPASPVDVSVYVGGGGVALDPAKLSPGPVELNITNQSGRPVAVAVTLGSGRTLTRSPSIPTGGTAELRTTLGDHNVAVGLSGQPSSRRPLTIIGHARTGDDELTQP